MKQLPKDPDRETLRDHYEASDDAPTECWPNYGDVNPQPHGGNWIHYDPDRGSWEHVGTFVAEEIGYPEDSYPDVDDPVYAQFVYYEEVDWRDLVTEDGGWTDAAQSTADTLHRGPETPAAAVVDDRLTGFVVAYADEHREAYSRRRPVKTGEYREILESVGVDPCEDDL